MRADRLGELAADGQDRIERGHRLLEDHGDVGAAQPPHLALGQRRELAPGEPHLAAGDPRHRFRQEPHDRQRRHRFAGAGLAGDAQRLAGGDVEGDMVDDDAAALGCSHLGDEIADGEDGVSGG